MGGSKQRSGHSGSRRPSRRSESEVGKFLRGEPKARETPKASETVDGGDDAVRHELEDFLEQDQAEIAAEYERIYRRSTQDPGTAGDEGEENWAAILRKWLPPSYQVVTKGRIVFPDGTATPQIDVLVLRGAYPPRLLDKKLYLSSGVVAAFECKNTLKAHHIKKAAKTAALVKANTYLRRGSLLAELYSPPVYGLLAHSHSWKAESSTPIKNIDVKIAEVLNSIGHPSELIDIICVADLAAWTLTHWTECPWLYPDEFREFREKAGAPPEGSVTTGYFRYGGDDDEPPDDEPASEAPNPVAVLVSELLKRLAWDDPDLLPLADYFRIAGIRPFGIMTPRFFGLDVLSEEVQERLRDQGPSTGPESFWDEWYGMIGGPS